MPLIWQLSATHFNTKTLLHGVLVKDKPPLYMTNSGSIKNLFSLLRSYFVTLFNNEEIIIEVDGRKINATTDEHGSFSLELDFLVEDSISIYSKGDKNQFEAVQQYPVIFPESAGPYEVVSDIDDTIMVSYSADFFKRITTVAFTSPIKRNTIDYTHNLFKALQYEKSRIFYVSKSESNLFGMISSFLNHHELPKGDIFLTPYLSFAQLFRQKKGKSYKEERISYIIANSSKNIILVGDDSQKDMEVYATIFNKFPERILNIYIRQTKSSRSESQLKKWQELISIGANITYFKNKDVFDNKSLINKVKTQL